MKNVYANGKILKETEKNDSSSGWGPVTHTVHLLLYFKICCNIVGYFLPTKKVICKNIKLSPKSLAENRSKYLSGSTRSDYFQSFEAKEKFQKERHASQMKQKAVLNQPALFSKRNCLNIRQTTGNVCCTLGPIGSGSWHDLLGRRLREASPEL